MIQHIKICGLSNQATLDTAIVNGATMVGFVFFEKSPRHVSLEQAKVLAHIARQKDNLKVQIVALTVNASDIELQNIIYHVQPDILQLHGQETVERVHEVQIKFRVPIMKAINVSYPDDFEKMKPYQNKVDWYLLDSQPPKDSLLPGGNGQTFNWQILKKLSYRHTGGKPIMLAGGLTPHNVSNVIHMLSDQAYVQGIDVSSGVEKKLGIKDNIKIQQFLEYAKSAIHNYSK